MVASSSITRATPLRTTADRTFSSTFVSLGPIFEFEFVFECRARADLGHAIATPLPLRRYHHAFANLPPHFIPPARPLTRSSDKPDSTGPRSPTILTTTQTTTPALGH